MQYLSKAKLWYLNYYLIYHTNLKDELKLNLYYYIIAILNIVNNHKLFITYLVIIEDTSFLINMIEYTYFFNRLRQLIEKI